MCELPWSPLPPGNYERPPRTSNWVSLAATIRCSARVTSATKSPARDGAEFVCRVKRHRKVFAPPILSDSQAGPTSAQVSHRPMSKKGRPPMRAPSCISRLRAWAASWLVWRAARCRLWWSA